MATCSSLLPNSMNTFEKSEKKAHTFPRNRKGDRTIQIFSQIRQSFKSIARSFIQMLAVSSQIDSLFDFGLTRKLQNSDQMIRLFVANIKFLKAKLANDGKKSFLLYFNEKIRSSGTNAFPRSSSRRVPSSMSSRCVPYSVALPPGLRLGPTGLQSLRVAQRSPVAQHRSV